MRKGKGELYDFIRASGGTIFRNADLDYLQDMARGIAQQVTYGTTAANYVGEPVTDGIFIGVAMKQPAVAEVLPTHLVGSYNFPNVMAAIAIGLYFDVPVPDIKAALDEYQPDNSRSQWVKKGTNQLILDAYNANPSSMKAAIQNFATTTLPHKRLWIGGMKEMGAQELEEHQQIAELINNYEWDQVILCGKEFEGLQGQNLWFATSAEAATYISANPPTNSSILIKGSRGSKMEILAAALEG